MKNMKNELSEKGLPLAPWRTQEVEQEGFVACGKGDRINPYMGSDSISVKCAALWFQGWMSAYWSKHRHCRNCHSTS